jgi:hypothetical protein
MRRLFPIGLCVLACRAPAAPLARVPFEGPSHLVFLPVAVDGHDAGWWLLDSGFDYSVASGSTAEALRLPHGADTSVAQPGGTVEQSWTGAVSLAFGGVPFRAESLAVIDLAGLEPLVGRPIGGILGHDVFARYVLAIDYDALVIDVFEPATFGYRGDGTSLPLWIEHGETFVTAQLHADGRMAPAKLKLDTGSSSFLGLNGSFVDQNNLVAESRARIPATGAALGGLPEHFVSRLDSLVLGPWTIARPVAAFSASLARDGDAGTVGADLLRRFRCIFDYSRRRLILEPRPVLKEEVGFDASGLVLIAAGPRLDSLQVLAVSPDSPGAEAGLATGDRIVDWSVKGETLGLIALRRRLDTPGERLDLVVERAGARRVASVVTRERI